MRGAVSIALAYNQVRFIFSVRIYISDKKLIYIDFVKLACFQFTFSGVTLDPVHATIITSTIIVVFFTTLV